MKRVLAFSGIRGDGSHLHRILREAQDRRAEAMLFTGGIFAEGQGAEDRAAFLVSFFEALGNSGRFAAVIPAPGDGPLHEFLRAAVNAENTFPNVFSVHATPVPHGDTIVGGIGGNLAETGDGDGPPITVSRAAAQYFLRGVLHADKPIKVMLLADAPPGALAGGPGNPIAEELIHTVHPKLCVVAGTRTHRGTCMVGDTLVVNPGSAAERSAAWIERIPGEVELVDL